MCNVGKDMVTYTLYVQVKEIVKYFFIETKYWPVISIVFSYYFKRKYIDCKHCVLVVIQLLTVRLRGV